MIKKKLGDRGASLIVVLIIVTVISTVMSVVLGQMDTSIRATVALRDQASNNYAGDAAAQAVITQLQTQLKSGSISTCSDPTAATLINLGGSSGFYVPAQTHDGPINAAVQCAPDNVEGKTTQTTTTGTGVTIDTTNTIGYGVLTVGSAADQFVVRGNTPTCVAGGSVVVNSNIKLAGQGSSNSLKAGTAASTSLCTLTTDSSIVVTSAATNGCNGSNNDSTSQDFTPTPCTHASAAVSASTWKALAPLPSGGYTVTNPAPLCYTSGSTTYAAFRPGKYTLAPGTGSVGCTSSIGFAWFTPGTYYFDYGSQWSWPATVVGGTPLDSSGNVIPSLVGLDVTTAANASKLSALSTVTKFPGACADPAVQNKYNGVEFVFGGSSTILPSSSGNNEVCATYSSSGIPVAMYGVSYDVVGASSMSLTGGGTINAETLCASSPCTSSSTGGLSLIASDPNGGNSIYVQGYLYAPSAPFIMTFKNSAGLLLGWGVVVREFDFTENGTSPKAPFVAYRPILHQGQITTTTATYAVRYVNVWICAASATACSRSGTPNLRVKVRTNADGTISVLSWSHLR